MPSVVLREGRFWGVARRDRSWDRSRDRSQVWRAMKAVVGLVRGNRSRGVA